MNKILIGNTFPLTLARRKFTVEPASMEALRKAVDGKEVLSFWGHANTLAAASAVSGVDLTPKVERPVLSLSPDKLPMLDNQEFKECWIVSPDYRDNFRPAINVEIPGEMISGWQVLKLTWDM